tara:strand:+ start:272 stop:493 length:222 start_codon:yes stop_codon:yes gene_type:complete
LRVGKAFNCAEGTEEEEEEEEVRSGEFMLPGMSFGSGYSFPNKEGTHKSPLVILVQVLRRSYATLWGTTESCL